MKCCAECTPKNYHPIKYTLGKCDKCGCYLGVAEVEYRYDMPEGFDELFGHLDRKPKDV